MSYLNMVSEITIGDIVIKSPNSFTISEDVNFISDTAEIRLARNSYEFAGTPIAEHIKTGTKVEIKCGYDELHTEFIGYIKPGINEDFPLVIQCDEAYPLRQKKHFISERSITLKSLANQIAPMYKIECLDIELGKVRFSDKTALQILEELKNEYGFFSRIDNDVLSIGYCFDFKPNITQKHIFKIGENVKDASGLRYEVAADQNIKVIANINLFGKKIKLEFGSEEEDAKEVKPPIGELESEINAKNKLRSYYQKIAYDGFKGSIKAFGKPIAHAGDSIEFIDSLHPHRNGTYLIEKSKLVYEDAHIERELFISYKLD